MYQQPYQYVPYNSNYGQQSNLGNYQNIYPQYPQYQQSQIPVQPIIEQNSLNAKYVSGWEEVKNIPYTEKPIMLLDANAKKLYIKGMNEKGEKEIETYSLFEENKPNALIPEIKEEKGKTTSPIDIDVKIENEINKAKENLQEKINSLEEQIKELKNNNNKGVK